MFCFLEIGIKKVSQLLMHSQRYWMNQNTSQTKYGQISIDNFKTGQLNYG